MSMQAAFLVRALPSMKRLKRDALWDALEWLAMPLFMLYPQLAVLKWYRYGSRDSM